METPASNQVSLRRSSRMSATSYLQPPAPFSNPQKSDPSPVLQENPFKALRNSSNELAVKTNSQNAGASSQESGFTKKHFQLLCDKQRKDFKEKGKRVGDLDVRSPSQIVDLWSPASEKNMELADEVNEWIEFLPYGDGNEQTGSSAGGEKATALGLCKWILTTRSQDESGHWKYVDRQATREEIMKFKEKGWPWYR